MLQSAYIQHLIQIDIAHNYVCNRDSIHLSQDVDWIGIKLVGLQLDWPIYMYI